MKQVTLIDLVETTADDLKDMLLEGMDESEWAKDDIPALYLDVRNNLDKIYAIHEPSEYINNDFPAAYLVYLKDGSKLLVDSNRPEFYIDIARMTTLDKDIKGADADDLSYEMIIPKGSLVYEMHPECDVLVALSPDLKQGMSTPGSGAEPIILSNGSDIFEYDYDDEDFDWILDESGHKKRLMKYDFVVKTM